MGLYLIYFGQGQQPDMVPVDAETALPVATDSTKQSSFLCKTENSALNSAVFHCGLYRALVIFLGIESELTLPSGSCELNFVDMWQGQRGCLLTDDVFNANTILTYKPITGVPEPIENPMVR